jgi:phospholipid-binding lipoprotein MlaA
MRYPIGVCAILALFLLGGCATDPNHPDPCEGFNRAMYGINDGLDKLILHPASQLYDNVIPRPIRTGIGNAFDNLGYINVILNDFLQGKNDQGWSDAGRMAVNSTVGLAGFIDVGTNWGMPEHHNDFGITLGKWGAKPGPYLVLPLFGPSTFRDAPAIPVSMVTNPLFWIDLRPEISIPLDVVSVMDERSRASAAIHFRDTAALDPYIFTRDAYLQMRANRITEGHAPPPEPNFYDEAGPTTRPTTRPRS